MDKFFSDNKTKFYIAFEYYIETFKPSINLEIKFTNMHKEQAKKQWKIECLPSEIYNKLKDREYHYTDNLSLKNYNTKCIGNIIFTVSYIIFKANTNIPSITNKIYDVNLYNTSKSTSSLCKNDYTKYLSAILLLSI